MKNIKKRLFIIIVALMCIKVSSVVYAEEETTTSSNNYNGTEGQGDTVNGNVSQFTEEERGMGFISEHTGYRFYIVEYEEWDGMDTHKVKSIITDGVDIYMSQPDNINHNIQTYDKFKEDGTGKAHNIVSHPKDDIEVIKTAQNPIPCPIVISGGQFAVNGNEFKKWMLQDRGDGDNNATALIREFWGEEILEKFLSNSSYRLVVEPIMWSNMYKFNSDKFGSYWCADSTLLLGTATEWARYMTKWGDPKGLGLSVDSADKPCFIQIIYASALPNCLVIERKDSYFQPPVEFGTRLRSTAIEIFGYGEHLYSPSDIAEDLYDTASTQTYDTKLGAKKGSAPVPSKLKDSTIIKLYQDVDADGNIVKTSVPYIRIFNPNRITVNDETNLTGYTVVEIREGASIGSNTRQIFNSTKMMKNDWSHITVGTNLIKQYDELSGAHDDFNATISNGDTLYVLLRKRSSKITDNDYNADTGNVETNIELSESYISKIFTASDYTIKSSNDSNVDNIKDATLLFGSFDTEGNELTIKPKCSGHKKLKCTTEEHTHDSSCGTWCDKHNWWYNKQEAGESCPGNSECEGHTRPACGKSEHIHDDNCYTTTYCTYGKYTDNSLKFNVKYDSVIQTQDVLVNAELFGNTSQKFSVKADVDPDEEGIVRAEQVKFKGIDANLKITREKVDVISRTGQSSSRSDSGNTISNTVVLRIVEDTNEEDVNTNYRAKTGDKNESCWKTPYNFAYKALNPLDVTFKTKILVYSGQQTVYGSADTIAVNLDSNKYAYKSITNNGVVTVLPLIQMQEQTSTNLHSLVTVGGKYLRQISGFKDFAMVYISNKSSDNNIIIESSQWSNHKGAHKAEIDPEGQGYVLPGGAIIDMTTNNGNGEMVAVKTYQVVSDKVKNVKGTTTLGGISEARLNHKELVNSAKTEMSKLFIQQYIEQDGTATEVSADSTSETKYYLRDKTDNTVDESQKNDLSVVEGSTDTAEYKISTDMSGNVLLDGNVILTRGQGVTDLTSDLARDIESKTCAISAILNSIERNTGDDVSAPWAMDDGHWYNESVGEIEVYVQTTYLNIGFESTRPVRGCVIDPKLCPVKTGVGSMWSSSVKSWFESNAMKVGQITFKGQSLSVNTVLNNLYRSRNFYIPDVNVQDLLK